jgi:hypothetical protein
LGDDSHSVAFGGWLGIPLLRMSLSPFKMSSGKIAKIKQGVLEQVERDDLEEAWRLSQPLLKAARELETARALSDLTRRGAFAAKNGLVAARALANAHPTDIEVLSNLGRAFERLHDIRYLNAAPPDDPILTTIANALSGVVASRVAANDDEELALLNGLGVAARVLGRSWDQVAERSERRLVELRGTWQNLYGLGLFYKTRGRFEDGRDANKIEARPVRVAGGWLPRRQSAFGPTPAS